MLHAATENIFFIYLFPGFLLESASKGDYKHYGDLYAVDVLPQAILAGTAESFCLQQC